MGVEFRDASTPGPGIKALSKCPRTPPIALVPAGVSSGRHPSPTQCQGEPLPHPSCPCRFPRGGCGARRKRLHIPQAGGQGRPHMEEEVSYSLGGTAEIKIKHQNCLLKSWLGHEYTQATGRTRSAQGQPRQWQGRGRWAGSGPDPMGAVTSGAEVSAVAPLMSERRQTFRVGCPVHYRAFAAVLPHSSHCCQQDPS